MKRNTSLMAEDARLPAPPKRLPRGNHRYSVFAADFCDLTEQGAVQWSHLEGGESFDLLLFTHDVPGMMEMYSFFPESFGARPLDNSNWLESGPHLTNAAADILATQIPIHARAGEVVRGTTVTAGVEVAGFPTYAFNVARGLVDVDLVGMKPRCTLYVVANSGVPDGPLNWYVSDLATISYRSAILIYEEHYTQAMKNNGNIYTDPNGNVFEIVGLFHNTAVNPQ